MDIIRKELAVDQVFPANLRYNDATDTVESTSDGGATWQPAPGSDPRIAQPLGTRPGVASSCQNAAAIIAVLQQLEGEIVASLTAGTAASALGTGILAIIALWVPYISLLYLLIFTFATSLVALGAGAIETAFTAAVWHDLECLIYDFLQAGVPISDTSLGLLEGQVTAQFDPVVAAVINGLFELMGGGGVNTIMSAADASAGCLDCQACDGVYDLTFAPYGASLCDFTWTQHYQKFGHWASGQGWVGEVIASPNWGNLAVQFFCPNQPKTYHWRFILVTTHVTVYSWRAINANDGHQWDAVYNNNLPAGTHTIDAAPSHGGQYDTILQFGCIDPSKGTPRITQLTVSPT